MVTTPDYYRFLVLFGYVAARLADGNWKLALFDIAVGAGLLAVMHWLDEIRFSPSKS